MKHTWTWQRDPANSDRFRLLYGPDHVGDVWWIIDVAPGHHSALDRIVAALNGVIGDTPDRCWTLGAEGTPMRWSLDHNGRAAGEVVWSVRPKDEHALLEQIVAGLNHSESRALTPTEPAAMVTHDGRPMRYAHGTSAGYVLDQCRCTRCTGTQERRGQVA